MSPATQSVFIAGGTGYIGSRLISRLLHRGHRIRALVRAQSQDKLPAGCTPVLGNALEAQSYCNAVMPATTFVQLVGVAHPSPAKAAEFRRIDLVAGREAVAAAGAAGIQHFVYVSDAQPAPMMKAYISVRAECEARIRESGLNATILTVVRPGPGHRWPYGLIPAYWLMEPFPWTREGARRLGLVTLEQIVRTLVGAVEQPCLGVRVLGVPEIRLGTFDTPSSAVTT